MLQKLHILLENPIYTWKKWAEPNFMLDVKLLLGCLHQKPQSGLILTETGNQKKKKKREPPLWSTLRKTSRNFSLTLSVVSVRRRQFVWHMLINTNKNFPIKPIWLFLHDAFSLALSCCNFSLLFSSTTLKKKKKEGEEEEEEEEKNPLHLKEVSRKKKTIGGQMAPLSISAASWRGKSPPSHKHTPAQLISIYEGCQGDLSARRRALSAAQYNIQRAHSLL